MKFAHISDLHLGKRLHNVSLLEDQKYILEQIAELIEKEKVDAVLIAGDVYDKAVPPAEAVTLFDEFLVQMVQQEKKVFVISGNHDSPERIAFASRLIKKSGVHLSPVYHGEIAPVVIEDEYGEIGIYLLPFIKPVHVRHYYPEEEIETYTDALNCALSHVNVDKKRRNVILAHQFVSGADQSGSEELVVGGLDNVNPDVFAAFDYAALGHIHRAQKVSKENIQYSGTPLKYSFSEVSQEKSVTIIEMKQKGTMTVSRIPLSPLRDVVMYRGNYEELMNPDAYGKTDTDAYVRAVLTEEEEVPNAFYNLRTVYPNLMQMEYDNTRTRTQKSEWEPELVEELQPEELFADFFEQMNHKPLSEEQREYLREKIDGIWNGGKE
jgi:exonuclease SbcD